METSKAELEAPKVEAPEDLSRVILGMPTEEPERAKPAFRVLELREGAYSYDGKPGTGILGSAQKIYQDGRGGAKSRSMHERAMVSAIVVAFMQALGAKTEKNEYVAHVLIPLDGAV